MKKLNFAASLIMEILNPGVNADDYIETFRCWGCGCVFKESEKKFHFVIISGNLAYGERTFLPEFQAECPNCKRTAVVKDYPVEFNFKPLKYVENVFVAVKYCKQRLHNIKNVKMENMERFLAADRCEVRIHCLKCQRIHYLNWPTDLPISVKNFVKENNSECSIEDF